MLEYLDKSGVRKLVIAGLASLCALFIIAKLITSGWSSDDGVMVNIITELFGIMVAVYLVDRLLDAASAREKRRVASIAMRALRQPLRNYVNYWLETAYGANPNPSQDLLTTLRSPSFHQQIQRRDFTIPLNLGLLGKVEWPDKANKSMKNFIDGTDYVLVKYSHCIEGRLLELLQHFSSEAHMYAVVRLNTAISGRQFWYQDLPAWSFDQHLGALADLISEYNKLVEKERQLTFETVVKLNRVYGKDAPKHGW